MNILHAKSDHSLGYGTASPSELVECASKLRIAALALTDLETLSGQVQFGEACRAHGIQAIAGVELRSGSDDRERCIRKRGRVVLLVRTELGYRNLCRIVSRRRNTPRSSRDPELDVQGFEQGLFILSDDVGVARRLLSSGVEQSALRLLLVRPGPLESEAKIRGASRELGIPMMADADAVMARPVDHELHLIQLAIRLSRSVATLRREGFGESPDRSLPTDDALFADVPDAVEETHRVAEACDFALCAQPWARRDPLTEEEAIRKLEALCRSRLAHDERRESRLREELEAIRRLGLAGYFLVFSEIAGEARKRRIPILGRGSAVSSLILHLLGMTDVDPVSEGLHFERFVHSLRSEPPDIDLDIASNRRDELIDWTFAHFGADRVGMIASHQTLQRRGAYRAGLLALGMKPRLVEQFAHAIPDEELELPSPIATLPEPFRGAAPLLERLISKPHHLSVHPGGVVITNGPIHDYAPLERAPKGVLVTQHDADSVERLGLLKIDLLGNRSLAELDEACAAAGLPVERIPADDPRTIEVISQARTLGCFQLESPLMRSVLAKLSIRGVGDITAALALVRPGPASGDAKAAFIRRAHGEERPIAPHPLLQESLSSTYGLLLYEEQIMEVLSVLTGVTMERADDLRSAILRSEDLEPEVVGLAERNGVTASDARAIWRTLTRFAAYSFSKAHAASYAWLAYRAAYMKTHHPAAFGCALLNHHGGLYPLRSLAADLQRSGVRILGPSVNRSAGACSLELSVIRVGLDRIKHLTRSTKGRLQLSRDQNGPFSSLFDLLDRTRPARREIEALVLSGACDDLSPLSRDSYPFAHRAVLEGLSSGLDVREANVVSAGHLEQSRANPHRLEVYRSLVRVQNELQMMEMHLSDHPLRILRAEAERYGCVPCSQVRDLAGRTIVFAGIVAAARRVLKKPGEVLQFVTFEDETGLLETVVPPGVYARLAHPVRSPGPYLLSGRVEVDHGFPHLVIATIRPFHLRDRPYAA